MKRLLVVCPHPENQVPGQRLKFEQYFFTGLYGLTAIGIGGLVYNAATGFGAEVHLVFVSDVGVTRLYENGVDRGTVAVETLIAGVVDVGGWLESLFGDPINGEICSHSL